MAASNDAKRREAERRGETFQEEPVQHNLPYPKSVFLILGNEFCERLSYYGMKSILSIYINQKLHFDHDRSTTIYHTFTMLCYFCPMFGAMIADQFLGKFKTIVYISIIYVLGHLLKTLAAVPTLGVPPVEFSLLGLLLIAIGTGGIKPCVVAFGGDQFKIPEQERQLQSFFSVFYFFINAGSLIGTAITPILREDVHCFGDESCFSLAFGVPGVLMALAVIILVVGKNKYTMVPPQGSILVRVFGSVFYAGKKAIMGENRTGDREHWMDLAKDKYESHLVDDVKSLLRVLVMYIPIPVFWALYDQSGSRWTFQATGMDGSFGATRIKPDQMQVVNPILVMVFIPLFDKIIYPFFARFNVLKKPLQRMAVGGIITACSFFASGFLELQMQDTYAKVPHEGFSNIHFMNTIPCMVSIQLHNDTGLIHEETINELHNHVIQNIEAGEYLLDMQVSPSCLGDKLASRTGEVMIETHGHKVSGVYLGVEGDSVFPTVLDTFDDPHKDQSGRGRVKAVYNLGQGEGKSGNLTLVSSSRNYTLNLELEGVSGTDYTRMDPMIYKAYYDNKLLGDVTVDQGGVYSLILTQDPLTQQVKMLQHMLTTPNIVHMMWLLPQIIIITVGEIMFSITGIEFAYSQAPESMKSVVQALWLWTTAFGNVIVIFVAEAGSFDRASEFFMFACLMLVDMGLFILLAYYYKPKEEVEKERRSRDMNLNSLSNSAYNPDQ